MQIEHVLALLGLLIGSGGFATGLVALRTIKGQAAKLEAEAARLQAEAEKLQAEAEANATSQTIAAAQGALSLSREAYDALNRPLLERIQQLEKYQAGFELATNELKQAGVVNKEYEARWANAERLLAETSRNIETQTLEIAALKASLEARDKENFELLRRFVVLEATISKHSRHIVELQDERDALKRERKEWERQRAESAQRIKELEQTIAELRAEVDHLKAQRAERDTEIAGLKAQIEKLQAEKADLEARVSKVEATNGHSNGG